MRPRMEQPKNYHQHSLLDSSYCNTCQLKNNFRPHSLQSGNMNMHVNPALMKIQKTPQLSSSSGSYMRQPTKTHYQQGTELHPTSSNNQSATPQHQPAQTRPGHPQTSVPPNSLNDPISCRAGITTQLAAETQRRCRPETHKRCRIRAQMRLAKSLRMRPPLVAAPRPTVGGAKVS